MLKEKSRPPIGVKPKWLWLEQRHKDLSGAIHRYKTTINPPSQWKLKESIQQFEQELEEIEHQLAAMDRTLPVREDAAYA